MAILKLDRQTTKEEDNVKSVQKKHIYNIINLLQKILLKNQMKYGAISIIIQKLIILIRTIK